jgi:hypothetical protein
MSGDGKMRDGPDSESGRPGKVREGHDLFHENQEFPGIIGYGA